MTHNQARPIQANICFGCCAGSIFQQKVLKLQWAVNLKSKACLVTSQLQMMSLPLPCHNLHGWGLNLEESCHVWFQCIELNAVWWLVLGHWVNWMKNIPKYSFVRSSLALQKWAIVIAWDMGAKMQKNSASPFIQEISRKIYVSSFYWHLGSGFKWHGPHWGKI